MKKGYLLAYAILLFALVGCTNISQEEAEQIIIERYSNFMGKAEIISTEEKNDKYYIEWINEEDGSKGISTVSSDGEVEVIEAEIQ